MVTTPLDGQLQTRELTYIIKLDAETDAIKEIAMKTKKSRPNSFSHRYIFVLLVALITASAIVAVPVYSARAGLFSRKGVDSKSKTSVAAAKRLAAPKRSLPTAANSPETIATYAADCTTAKSTFYAGETVCAKTDNVTLPPNDQWWVNWILLDPTATVVSGGQGVTNVTTNPQTFTYAPNTPGSYKVSLTNLPNDISQTPAGFTVLPAPTLSTYTGDCTTSKTQFNLGETVCLKVSGLSNTEFPQRRLQLAEPDGFVLQRFNITDNSQQFSYVLPGSDTGTFAGTTIDHRGTWVVALVDPDSDLRVAIPITVHKSNLFVDRIADLQVSKLLIDLGDPPTAGTDISFQITFINQGPDPATSFILSDTTLPNTTFVSFNRNSVLLGLNRIADVENRANFDSDLLNPYLVRFARDPGLEFFAEDTSAVLNCVSPSVGSPGSTTCTADREIGAGETASFTAVYHINSSLPNGAVLTDGASVTVRSSTEDPRTTSNDSGVIVGSTNPTPPSCTLTCPGNMTVTADTTGLDFNGDTVHGANVSFSATASSSCGALTSTPASGTFFALGTTPVTITSGDGATCDFLVTVVSSGSAVTISCPANVSVNAGPNCNATVNLSTPATTGDNVTVTKTRSDGKPVTDPFPTGVTTVHWVASNSSGSDSCDQQITVADVTAPTITAINQTVSADANCQAVLPDYHNSANDNCACASDDNSEICQTREDIVVTQSVPAGTVVGLGSTSITLTATDEANNTATKTITFTVADTTAPAFTFVPAAITAYTGAGATTCDTVVNPGAATASDTCGPVTITRSPSGSTFPVGTTTINWTATDGANNTATATQTVTVIDNTPPVISCPANITAYLPLNSTATSMAVSYPAATASDNCGTVNVGYSQASGSVFPVGTTTVTVTANDQYNNSASCSFTIKVLYDFTGFFAPVNNPPVLNVVNSGRAIPVKFKLSGNKGLNIFVADSPQSGVISCDASAPATDLTDTLTAGGSSLSYDAGSDQYVYVWKTDSSWAGTCRQLVVTLNDGSVHVANFKFR